MRDAETIREIADMQTKATRLVRMEDIEDERHAYFDQRGNVLVQPLPIPARKHTVRTIESFAAAIKRYAEAATVWVVIDGVRCVLNDTDDNHRCDVLHLPVVPSTCFTVLESQDWTTQQKLIDTLRHSLSSATLDPKSTLPVLRNLKFSAQSEQSGTYTNSSAAMGKSVASQVTGDGELPETVSVEFHPFPSLSDEVDVAVVVFCTLFTDAANGKLKLAPRQGEIEKARTAAIRALAGTIQGAVGETPVFIGTP